MIVQNNAEGTKFFFHNSTIFKKIIKFINFEISNEGLREGDFCMTVIQNQTLEHLKSDFLGNLFRQGNSSSNFRNQKIICPKT